MSEENKTEELKSSTDVDQTLLLISGSKGRENDKGYVKKLANAVVRVFVKHGSVKMRCVGAAAVNNADKAFIIAKKELAKRDIHILLDQSFANVVFDGVEKTGILKEVVETD